MVRPSSTPFYTESGEGWRLLPSEGGPSVAFPVPPDVYSPVWSPDGRSIAWMHVVVGRSRLGVAALGSIRITDLTPSDYNIDQYPTWAPDNDRLAVKRQYDLTWDLYVASRTSSVQPLVVGAGPVFEPDWSLARNKIAFVRPYAAAPANGIYVVDPDGSNVRQLVSGSYDGAVWWSPDGSTIAFWGWINGVEAQSITMVDVATGGVRSLPLPAGIYPAHRPWSSDGSQFLLSNQQGMITPGVVYTLALDGTLTRVSPDSVSAVFPVWIR